MMPLPTTGGDIVTDPLQLVRGLDADAIRERMAELDRERAALRVLLRAARHTQQPASRATAPAAKTSESRKAVSS
jgi:hypothetical protein